MSYSAIQVEDLCKEYQIGSIREQYGTLRDSIVRAVSAPFRRATAEERSATTLHALKNISFNVPAGEVLGIIGRNGAGKSTLLKVLSRITEPTHGRIKIRGRVASLLEVGTGFHAELTGRENLYLNGSILGMSRREIQSKFDEIVAFAEVERFIDTPVKRYSSGMYLRLAFAVAAHLDPEILVVDEVLAVGDATFQNKCIGRMREVANEGRTVLFVSHSMPSIRALCNRCIWLRGGQLEYDGSPAETIHEYLQEHVTQGASADLTNHPGRHRTKAANLRRLTVLNGDHYPTSTLVTGQPVTFRVELDLPEPIRLPRGAIWVTNDAGVELFTLDSNLQTVPFQELRGRCHFDCTIAELALAPGSYTLNLAFGDATRFQEHIESVLTIDVVAGDFFNVGKMPPRADSLFLVRSNWVSHPAGELVGR